MSVPIVLRREAREEFDAAADWYNRQRPGAGRAFVIRVNETLGRIATDPDLHPVVYQDVRRAMVTKFPYAILYRPMADHVLVIAIFHTRRDPGSWKSRT